MINFRALFLNAVRNRLQGDPEAILLEGFDAERKCDTIPATRADAYTFAFGVFRDFPGNPVYGREDVWELVLVLLDRMAEWMHDDGFWDWYVPATGKTHRNICAGSVFAWMRVLKDFGEHIEPERRGRIESMLRTTLEARSVAAERYLADPEGRPTSFNLFIKWMLELWYGGGLFDEQGWRQLGETVADQMISLQTEDGYWPDARVHRGPVGNYNIVTLSGVAEYAFHSGSEAARKAVARAAEYHFRLTYPDGTSVETSDERNRHGPDHVNPKLIWALAPFEETRGHAAYFAERFMDKKRMDPGEVDFGVSAAICERLDAVPDRDVTPLARGNFRHECTTIPSLILQKRPWYVCLSGATTNVPGHMFHHDLQNHLSIWHDAVGLVVGGGNSLQDPPFSTFRFGTRYLADGGEVDARGGRSRLRLEYGTITAHLEVSIENDRVCLIRAETEGDLPADSDFALHLPYRSGDTFRSPHVEEVLGGKSIYTGVDDGEAFTVGPVRIESPNTWLIMWPVCAVNIYNLPLRLPVDSAVVRFSTRLQGDPVELRLAAGGG